MNKSNDLFPSDKPTTVVHIKQPHDVYIGRGTKWGNPWRISATKSREDVIAMYEQYIMGRTDLLASLDELRGKVLGCHCKPKACHGDVLAKLADKG